MERMTLEQLRAFKADLRTAMNVVRTLHEMGRVTWPELFPIAKAMGTLELEILNAICDAQEREGK